MKYIFSIKNLFLFVIVGYSVCTYALNNSIILFVDQYPMIKIPKNKETKESLSKKLKQPDYVYKKLLKKNRLSSGAQGAMGMYLGYAGLSDKNGQITFPRKHQKPVVNVLVTKGIQPVYIIAPATIHNWMLDKDTPAQMYEFKFDKDQETELYYIEAKKIPLPQDYMIPLETIIIIANPKNVYIPEGATLTHYSANLILPTIYIKKEFNFAHNVLYTNSIKQYFDSIHAEYKPEELSIAALIK